MIKFNHFHEKEREKNVIHHHRLVTTRNSFTGQNRRKMDIKSSRIPSSNNIWYTGTSTLPLLWAKFRLHRLHEIFIRRRRLILRTIPLTNYLENHLIRIYLVAHPSRLLSPLPCSFVHNPRAIYTRRAKRGGRRQASFPNYGMRKNYQVGTWLFPKARVAFTTRANVTLKRNVWVLASL